MLLVFMLASLVKTRLKSLLANGNYDGIIRSRACTVVRVLAFHQCGPGSIPGFDSLCGLSLVVLYSVMRGLLLDTPSFPFPQKLKFDLICSDFSRLPN